MKKAFLIVIAAFVLAGTAFGALGDVVGSFTTGVEFWCNGLVRSDYYLYAKALYPLDTIYCINPANGSICGSYPVPVSGLDDMAPGGGDYIYTIRPINAPPSIYKFEGEGGGIVASYALPEGTPYSTTGIAARCTGDGGDGTDALFLSDWVSRRLTVWPLEAGRPYSFALPAYPSSSFGQIAYDWRNALIWGTYNDIAYDVVYFYGMDTTGSVVTSFIPDLPETTRARSIAYYGEYLWIGTTYGTTPGAFYKIHCPDMWEAEDNTNIAPASLGRVKAVFR